MEKCVVGYLLYLTEDNANQQRLEIVDKSIKSFKKCFLNQDCKIVIVNNGTIIPDEFKDLEIINLSQNYFDVAVHYVSVFTAEKYNIPYFMYVYEDFMYYNNNFIDQCTTFLDETKIKSMRIPAYDFNNQKYNTKYTPRSKNPDAVRHDVGAGNLPLIQKQQKDDIFITNWRPNSRPMLWNTEYFLDKFALKEISPIMQPFEKHMYDIADDLAKSNQWMSSFLNKGVCSTVPVETSIREKKPLNYWYSQKINVQELKEEI